MDLMYIIIFVVLILIILLCALIFFDVIPAPKKIFDLKYTTTKDEGMSSMSEYQRRQLQERREYKYLQYRGKHFKNCQRLDKDGEYDNYYDEVVGEDADGYYEEDDMDGENEESSFYNNLIDAINNASRSGAQSSETHEEDVEKYRDAIRDLSNEQLDDVTGYVDDIPEANSAQCLSMGNPSVTPLCKSNPIKTSTCDSGCGTYIDGIGTVCCTSKCCPNLGVSCSNTSDNYCSNKNREPCTDGTIDNTCGPCLPGYSGDEGPSNNACTKDNN